MSDFNDADILSDMPELPLPSAGEVSYPDAASRLAAQKEFFRSRLEMVASLEMNEANLERVKVIKKGIVGWRTSFQKQADAYMKAAYKAPMDVFKAVVSEVEAEIKQMEDEVDSILDKEEEKRRANVNCIIDGIVADMEAEYGITVPDLVRDKKWYNKTADMRAVAEEIRGIFAGAKKDAEQREADIRLIERMCDDPRLDKESYISLLTHEGVSVVAEKIDAAKKRLAEQDKTNVQTEQDKTKAQTEPVVLGVAVDTEKLRSDFAGLNVKMVLELEYPTDIRDELTRVFGELRKNGVKMRVISRTEPEIPVF